jgi:hypothetical protein
MFWTYLIALVITTTLSYFLAPKPKYNAPKAAGLNDFTVPTAEEGREIPVLFGTRDLAGPNVTWYGDLLVEPVQKSSGGK